MQNLATDEVLIPFDRFSKMTLQMEGLKLQELVAPFGLTSVFVVRCPFREEHLAVCRNFFYMHATLGKMSPSCHVMSHHITPPMGGYRWLLVLAWGKWFAQMDHQYTKVYGT